MSKCYGCKNLIAVNSEISKLKGYDFCKFNNDICIESKITECSHFEEKQDTKGKPKQSMKLSMSCVQPSNHGRKGTMPRSRKGCFKKKEHKHILLNGRCMTCDKEMEDE